MLGTKSEGNIIEVVRGNEGILSRGMMVQHSLKGTREWFIKGIFMCNDNQNNKVEIKKINRLLLVKSFANGEWQIKNTGTFTGDTTSNFCVLKNISETSLFSGFELRIFSDRLIRKPKK